MALEALVTSRCSRWLMLLVMEQMALAGAHVRTSSHMSIRKQGGRSEFCTPFRGLPPQAPPRNHPSTRHCYPGPSLYTQVFGKQAQHDLARYTTRILLVCLLELTLRLVVLQLSEETA